MNQTQRQTATEPNVQTIGFFKKDGLWYADLPEFVEKGLGDWNNLLMVDGSDTFLDLLSAQTLGPVKLSISSQAFSDHSIFITRDVIGMDKQLLDEVGHNPVAYGAYYQVQTYKNNSFQHRLWLCPVAEWFFGAYPEQIYAAVA